MTFLVTPFTCQSDAQLRAFCTMDSSAKQDMGDMG
jgi:hypothetical protein